MPSVSKDITCTVTVAAENGSYKKEPLSKQSANALFTFMDKIDYLKMILKKGKIYPRYYKEDIAYLNLSDSSSDSSVAYPMKCFCDIFLNRLESHMALYGKYGIALTKDWGHQNNIHPIQYIKEGSRLYLHLQYLYDKGKKNDKDEKRFYDILGFIKPLSGKMPRNGTTIETNFYDEKEWRYIPQIRRTSKNYSSYIVDSYSKTTPILNDKSNAFFENDKYGLKISVSDIKYIILPTENEKDEFINFLISECRSFNRKDKYNLISKLVVFESMEGDW